MTTHTGTERSVAPVLLTGFFLLAIAHLGLMLADVEPWTSITKPLPALTLLAYALATRRGGLLALALLLCAAADVVLDLDGLFVVGVVMFGLAHLCFIVLLVLRRARLRVPIVLAYLVVWVLGLWWLWSDLGELRFQLAGYSLLVVAMAIVAAGLNRRTGLGGALFVVSDTLIAVGLAGREVVPQQGVLVMVTYFAALYFLATGVRRRT
ncbi:lysoplasmalogenase family protein [Tenggerimyces flavus]|uniref:Lysoplasmalogenase family protein n=1 Tax=Tenggerimyces flavus TaxID=1708749 RepID=A0ABV7Y7I7_9ACTN|nr:lysoplasmalogenase family protein [Tenggerimyces flavus]MBM7785697.1 putative membrane protein YhhN [Tenggerimyces flavus]